MQVASAFTTNQILIQANSLISIPKLSGKVSAIRTIRERTVSIHGVRIFNSMPRIIRDFNGDFSGFKSLVDIYLMDIPDCPILDGYISHNLDRDNKPSNSLIDWNANLNNVNWTPGVLNTQTSSIV